MKKTLLLLGAAACATQLSAQPKLTADNVDEVLKALTLEEKAALCVGSGWDSMLGITSSSDVLVSGAAGTTRAVERLGIPMTVTADGPAGVRINPTREGDSRTYYATGFPVGTAIASSWDTELVENMTKAMGNEVLEYGVDVLLSPAMNIHRNPLCGRNFEYFSEDPVLSGKISAAYVRGVQSNGVGTSVKHFAVNNQETNRAENDSRVDTRALREIYLKGYEITVKESQPWTIMSSYNKLNGEYTQQSHDLLTKILRDEWGFEGIVMTDWGNKEGTVKAVAAGNDLMMPGSTVEVQRIVDAVKSGELSEADLDRNVRNMLKFIVKTPRFNGYKYSDAPDLKAHAAAARAAATESMVLLKNDDNVLPLKGTETVAMFGISSVDFVAGGTGSGNVNKAYVVNMVQGLENAGFTLVEDIKDFNQKYVDFQKINTRLNSTNGPSILLGDAKMPEAPLSRGVINAQVDKSDLAIVVIGRNSGESADRRVDDDFNLTATERQLITGVTAAYHLAGKKVVVVLNIGGAIETASWKNMPDAILCAWQPGQEGGDAVADVLTGKVNPSGKLPMTFPMDYMDHPSSLNFPTGYEQQAATMFNTFGFVTTAPEVKNVDYTDYDESIWVGYRWFTTQDKEVSYPFGYGLSYTTFEYSKPSVKLDRDGNLTATVTVTNTGSVAGKEVVEVYVAAPAGGLEKPARELKAFDKTDLLEPGASQTLSFTLTPYELASFNIDANEWQTAAGSYTLYFAKNANDTATSAKVNVRKASSFEVTDAYAGIK